jgi:dipeptidyl aminopeptidase/acylaminoacyl peptidase
MTPTHHDLRVAIVCASLVTLVLGSCTGPNDGPADRTSGRALAGAAPSAAPAASGSQSPGNVSPAPLSGAGGVVFLDVRSGRAEPAVMLDAISGGTSFIATTDGRRIAFVAPDPDGIDQVYVIGRDGRELRQVSHGSEHASAPSWSPDGDALVFLRERGGTPSRIVVADLLSARTTIAIDARSLVLDPGFAPDGRTILFTWATRSTVGAWRTDVWTVPRRGGRPTRVIRHAAYGSMSPDGSTIAFHRTAPQRDAFCGACWWIRGGWVTLVPSDGSEQRGPAVGGLLTAPDAYGITLRWSPDGALLVTNYRSPSETVAPIIVRDPAAGRDRYLGLGARPSWLDDHTLIVESYEPDPDTAAER